MSERDYYPAGAYNDPSAPYNQVDIPEAEFDIDITVTYHKSDKFTTSQYNIEGDEFDTYYNLNETNLKEEYRNNGLFTPLELIDILREKLEKEYEEKKDTLTISQKYRYQELIESCKGWEEEDTYYEA